MAFISTFHFMQYIQYNTKTYSTGNLLGNPSLKWVVIKVHSCKTGSSTWQFLMNSEYVTGLLPFMFFLHKGKKLLFSFSNSHNNFLFSLWDFLKFLSYFVGFWHFENFKVYQSLSTKPSRSNAQHTKKEIVIKWKFSTVLPIKCNVIL